MIFACKELWLKSCTSSVASLHQCAPAWLITGNQPVTAIIIWPTTTWKLNKSTQISNPVFCCNTPAERLFCLFLQTSSCRKMKELPPLFFFIKLISLFFNWVFYILIQLPVQKLFQIYFFICPLWADHLWREAFELDGASWSLGCVLFSELSPCVSWETH